MSYLLPLAVTAVAFAVTYLACIRPTRRGHGRHAGVVDPADPAGAAEIRRLREEVQLLHHEVDLRTAQAAPREQPGR